MLIKPNNFCYFPFFVGGVLQILQCQRGQPGLDHENSSVCCRWSGTRRTHLPPGALASLSTFLNAFSFNLAQLCRDFIHSNVDAAKTDVICSRFRAECLHLLGPRSRTQALILTFCLSLLKIVKVISMPSEILEQVTSVPRQVHLESTAQNGLVGIFSCAAKALEFFPAAFGFDFYNCQLPLLHVFLSCVCAIEPF